MSRALITLRHNADRLLAVRWIEQAPVGTRVEFKATRRSVDQNSKLWASLTDISVQLAWHGKHLNTNDWKIIFIDALKRETSRVVPNIDGTGFVDLGRSSSDLSKDEMSQLIELVICFGAQHGVVFNDPTVPPDDTTLVPRHEREAVRA